MASSCVSDAHSHSFSCKSHVVHLCCTIPTHQACERNSMSVCAFVLVFVVVVFCLFLVGFFGMCLVVVFFGGRQLGDGG